MTERDIHERHGMFRVLPHPCAPVTFAGEVKELIINGSTWTTMGVLTLSCALVPVLEEYVYRGFLLPSLARDLPVPVAVRFPIQTSRLIREA